MPQTQSENKELPLAANQGFIEMIENLMNDFESSEVEFKSAKGGFPSSLWETYSSFANSQGGIIVLGVAEKNGSYSIDGLTRNDINKYKKAFWDNVNNKQKVSVNILKNSDVRDGGYEGNHVLVINVPRADRSQIPVYLNNNPDNTYKRYHEGDYKCLPDEVHRMFADADIEHPRDSKILPEFSIEDDIDVESLNQYRRLFAAIKPTHPWLLLDNKTFLTRLGGYRIDRREKKEGLTLAGLLMFGKFDSIVDVYGCPYYFPDYREYLSADPNDRWTDRICPDGTWEANLFQFYIRVFQKLSSALPKPFTLKEGIRVDETPTHIALREAFINALIHADYACDSNITIELWRDKYVFSNPGSLLISISQYWRGGDSVCRNKALQQMFMFLGTAEKAGSGVDKIKQGWNEANFRRPQLEEKKKPEKVVLELPLVSLLSDEALDYLKSNFGDEVLHLDNNKLFILATCCSEGEITNNRLQLVIDKHSSDITKLLKELCLGRYLIAEGIGRGTKYKLYPSMNVLLPVIDDSRNPASNTSNPVSNDTCNHLNDTSTDVCNPASNTSNSASNPASNTNNSTSNPAINTSNSASNDVDSASNRTAKQAKSGEMELRKQIKEVCSDYLSLAEMAVKIHKSKTYLKNFIIPQLLKSGLLEREFPNTPKHRKQRYRTIIQGTEELA